MKEDENVSNPINGPPEEGGSREEVEDHSNGNINVSTYANEQPDVDGDENNTSENNETEGDPEGTVTSKDGKTRITNFEVSWVGTDSDTVLGTTLDGSGTTKIGGVWGDTAFGEVINHNNTKLQVKYVISGERLYEPGSIKIKLPAKSRAEGYPESYVEASNIPMPKAKIVNGKIDYDADYGKAEYIYYLDGDDLIITNTVTIPAATSGTFLIDYFFPTNFVHNESNITSYNRNIPEDVRNMPDMYKFKIRPNIFIYIDEDEEVSKGSHTLYHQIDKTISGNIYKKILSIDDDGSNPHRPKDETEIYTKKPGHGYNPDGGYWQEIYDWNPNLNETIKPENYEDYYYMLYDVETFVDSVYSNSILQIEDILGKDQGQEIIGYFVPDDEYKDFDLLDLKKYGKRFKPYNELKENELTFTLDKFGPTGYYNKEYSNSKHLLLLVAFKKDLLLDQKEHLFTNIGKMTVKQLNSDDEEQVYTDDVKINIKYVPLPPKAEFSAPPGNKFSLEKYIKSDYPRNKSFSKMESIKPADQSYKEPWTFNGPGNGSDSKSWSLSGVVEALAETYDPKYGEKGDLDAYKRKTYKAELVDDYLYTGNDYKRELTSEDYEVNGVYLETEDYDYKRISRTEIGYVWGYKDRSIYGKNGITYPSKIYGRKESTGEWIELASFNFVKTDNEHQTVSNFISKFDIKEPVKNYIEIPAGFTSIKWEIEINRPKVTMEMKISATLKPSDYIQEMFKQNETSPGNSKLRIRNDGTLRVINNEGDTIGIPSTTVRDEKNSRTLDLDLENYGQEMYHDTAYWDLTLKTPEDKVFEQKLSKNIHDVYDRREDKKVVNNKNQKEFIVPALIKFEEHVKNDNGISLREYDNGVFYDLLPLGVSGVKNLKIYDYYAVQYNKENDMIYFKNKNKDKEDLLKSESHGWKYRYFYLNSNYELIENWQNTGRTLLVAKYDNAELVIPDKIKNDDKSYLGNAKSKLFLTYDMIYPWDSYKDYGGNLYNFVAFESGKESMESGLPDVPNFKEETEHHKIANEALKDLNKDNDNKNFLYAMNKTIVSGNTAANTGLTKHIKDSKDPKYSLATKTREGGQYSYRIRMQSLSGTTTSNLIFYDSIENYKPLKTDENYGVKRWKGTLEGIDLTQAKIRGADPKVYTTTIEGLNMQENKDITNTDIWKPYKEGDDLSKVQAIAIDLSKRPDGSDFKLKEEESINVTLIMRAPWDVKEKRIDSNSKALNEIYANTTITTDLDNNSKHKLINTAYTSINLEPAETTADIVAKKEYVDRQNNPLAIKEGQFEFKLTPVDGSVLKDKNGKELKELTATNDADGNIKFDTLYYNSWDVGKNPFTRTHTYKLEEIKGDDNKITYDSEPKYVKVLVERDGDTDMKTTVTYWADKACTKPLDNNEAVFVNRQAPARAKVIKVSSSDKDKRLANAKFELYKVSETEGKEDTLIQDKIITNDNGETDVIDNLDIGKYYFKEVKVPNGYVMINEKTEFEITEDDFGTTKEITISNEPRNYLPNTGKNGANFIILALATIGVATMIVGTFVNTNKKYSDLQ